MASEKQVNIINLHVGKSIEIRRKKAGYSQAQLASGLSLTRTSVVNIEKGRQSVTIENLIKICAILKCEPVDILPKTPKAVAKELEKVKKVVVEKLLSVDFKF